MVRRRREQLYNIKHKLIRVHHLIFPLFWGCTYVILFNLHKKKQSGDEIYSSSTHTKIAHLLIPHILWENTLEKKLYKLVKIPFLQTIIINTPPYNHICIMGVYLSFWISSNKPLFLCSSLVSQFKGFGQQKCPIERAPANKNTTKTSDSE